MEYTTIREGETLDMLSARLKAPGCMILRANGLFSPVWLLPGREIAVPDGDYCAHSENACPVRALSEPALTRQEGYALQFPRGETADGICARLMRSREELQLLIPLPDCLAPDSRVFVPDKNG